MRATAGQFYATRASALGCFISLDRADAVGEPPAMGEHRIFPHREFEQIVPGLWQLEGSLPFPLPRNMTVHRLKNGELLIYSAIALNDAGMAALEELGTPAWMIVPHPLHTMDAAFYKQRYPKLRVIAPDDARAKLRGVSVDFTPDAGLAELELRHHVAPGMRYTEIVLDLDVEGGRALVFTDLLSPGNGPSLLLELLGPPGSTGVPRIVKLRQVRDKPAVRRFVQKLSEAGDVRYVLFSHGPAVTEGAAGELAIAARGV
jgi:hypothetical protein